MITKSVFEFLNDLKHNNDRDWFAANKDRFLEANGTMKAFLETLATEMNKVDEIENTKLFRIYRDVRFSKDKTPYNFHFSISMGRQKPLLRGGYYLRLTPGGSRLACGFWNPSPPDLKRIRQNIDANADGFRSAISAKSIVAMFDTMEGEQVKTAPKGYSKEDPNIDLIRHKSFVFSKGFTDKEVCSKGFFSKVVKGYISIRPFFDYMSDILTHNLNGEPLY